MEHYASKRGIDCLNIPTNFYRLDDDIWLFPQESPKVAEYSAHPGQQRAHSMED
jgi:hypothetical protein